MSAKPDMSLPVAASAHPLRAISFGDPAVSIDRRADGTIYLRPKTALGDYPVRITDRLPQFDRPRADCVRCALCGSAVLPGVAGLFAGVEGLRQAWLPDEAPDA